MLNAAQTTNQTPVVAQSGETSSSPTESVKEPEFTLSIARSTRRWAIFKDDFTMMTAFEDYADEEAVPALARAWLKERGYSGSFNTIYPSITRVVFRSSPVRSRKRRRSPTA